MANSTRDKVIQQVVQMLQNAGASFWSVQDKGVLLAAIKLQLQQKGERARGKGLGSRDGSGHR